MNIQVRGGYDQPLKVRVTQVLVKSCLINLVDKSWGANLAPAKHPAASANG